METIEIEIRGSQPEPYLVEILRHKDNELEMVCDCPAGQNGTHCKHRISLLTASYESVIYGETTIEDLEKLATWVPGTKLESALLEVNAAEAELEKQKKIAKNAKRKLARIMEGG